MNKTFTLCPPSPKRESGRKRPAGVVLVRDFIVVPKQKVVGNSYVKVLSTAAGGKHKDTEISQLSGTIAGDVAGFAFRRSIQSMI